MTQNRKHSLICTKCMIKKEYVSFGKHKGGPEGMSNICLECKKIANKKWHNENKEYCLKYAKNYNLENKKLISEKSKLKRQQNPEKYRLQNKINRIKNGHKHLARTYEYRKEKLKNDIQFKLACNLRSRLVQAIKNKSKKGSAVRDLGCTISEFQIYIEKRFRPGMTWNNWKIDGWHLDHIVPLAKFDLTNIEEFKKAVHYSNMQPLWARENCKKGSLILNSDQISQNDKDK